MDNYIGDLKLSKELKEKLSGSDREGLGLGLGIGIGLGIIDRRSDPDRGSEPNTVQSKIRLIRCVFTLPNVNSWAWLNFWSNAYFRRQL